MSIDKKFAHLIQNIPFQSLQKKDISKIISHELDHLHCKIRELEAIHYQPQLIEYLADIWYNYNITRVKNGRGIYNEIISPRVVNLIDDLITNLNLKTLEVNLEVENHKLKATPIKYRIRNKDEL